MSQAVQNSHGVSRISISLPELIARAKKFPV